MHPHRLHLRNLSLGALLLALLAPCFEPRHAAAADASQAAPWSGKKSQWHGYDRHDFNAEGRPCYVVVPKDAAPGKPWVWRTTFPEFHAEADIALLGKGVHIAHLATSDLLGSPRAVSEGEKFYDLLTTKYGLSRKVALEGVSRGGLLAYNFAIKHPDQVACIYCDTPVLDFKSWPGGKGKGVGSKGDWASVPKLYKLSEAETLTYTGNPVDNAASLAAAKIPILHIVSEDDRVVPPAENTYLLKARLEKLGHTMDIISVPQGTKPSQGHHFTHPDPQRVVEFILKHASIARAVKHPNILFIFTDDQRPDAIAALGNPQIKTPNLDQLAQRGFVFRNAYCAGSTTGAVCLPSRTMMLSGLSLFHLPRLNAQSPNFARSLGAAGYETYHHGKWGNSPHKLQANFDHNKYLKDDDKERRSGQPGKEITDAAIAFLDKRLSKGGAKPFCMYLAYANPHDPCVADKKWLDKYDSEQIALPANFMPQHPFDNGELKVRDETLLPWPRTPKALKRHLRDYYAVTTALDYQVGRLLQTLDNLKLRENTIIVFSSDHGLALGSHGLMGKQNLYEHSMRAPLIFAGPGIPQGKSDALAYLCDIYPTVCELAGAPVPSGIDGRSLVPIIRGKDQQVRDTVFLAYRDVQRAVRRGPWKLIHYPKIDKFQLLNVNDDPDEMKNLAEAPEQLNRLKEMKTLLLEQQRLNDDPLVKK